MFKKTSSQAGTPDFSVPSSEIGLLGNDTQFKGNIRFKGTLRIDGIVEGAITSIEGSGTTLIINQQASVTGNIVSDSVLISGSVAGDVKAVERVEIFRNGTLKGDIETGDIMIEGGAEFQGNCTMIPGAGSSGRDRAAKNADSRADRQVSGGSEPARASA